MKQYLGKYNIPMVPLNKKEIVGNSEYTIADVYLDKMNISIIAEGFHDKHFYVDYFNYLVETKKFEKISISN